jgi:polysaccharide deacetylase 2 family uncharacterized protein YibQ
VSFSPPCKAAAIAILLCLLFVLVLFGCRSSEPQTKKKTDEVALTTTERPPTTSISIEPVIVFEEPGLPLPEEASVPLVKPIRQDRKQSAAHSHTLPRIAIIIDDMGHHQQIGRQLLQLDLNVTYSFLPNAPYTVELAETAHQTGRDILVHLPMEPKDPAWNAGAGALSVRDQPEIMREKTRNMLAAVPYAIGANNHMGSRFTEDAEAMRVVLASLKTHSFFFIDSYTTAASSGLATARQLNVPAARRQIFLDNIREPSAIFRRIEQLIAVAKKQGWAIGIGHPNKETLTALTRCRDQGLTGVKIVGVHQLVK